MFHKMKALSAALCCAAGLSPPSGAFAENLPPFEAIEAAVLAYANCIDQAVTKLAKSNVSSGDVARQAVSSCKDLRDAALKLRAVPVFEPTIAEFDEDHIGLARNLTADARGEPREPGQPR